MITENQRLIEDNKIRTSKPLPQVESDEEPYPLPGGWTWTRPDHLCYRITDGAHHTPTYTPSGIPFLSVKDVSRGVLDFSDTKFISEDQHEDLTKRCKPEFEDILLTKVGTTGIAKIVDVDRPFSIFVSLALLKFPRRYLFPRYFELMINSPLVKQQSSENTQGIGNKNLVLKHIRNFAVPLPPLPSVSWTQRYDSRHRCNQRWRYYATLAYWWIRGQTLKQLIDDHLSYNEVPADGKKINGAIRGFLGDLEQEVRFRYVKYLKAYIDTLSSFLSDQKLDDLKERVAPLHLYIEFGASDRVLLTLMSLGLSRTTSILIRPMVTREEDIARSDCWNRLATLNLKVLDIPNVCKAEIRGLLGL